MSFNKQIRYSDIRDRLNIMQNLSKQTIFALVLTFATFEANAIMPLDGYYSQKPRIYAPMKQNYYQEERRVDRLAQERREAEYARQMAQERHMAEQVRRVAQVSREAELARQLEETREQLARLQTENQEIRRELQYGQAPNAPDFDSEASAPRMEELMAFRRNSTSISNLKAMMDRK